MLDLEKRYAALTAELESLFERCPDVDTSAYGKWARRCIRLGFERLSIVNEMKDFIRT